MREVIFLGAIDFLHEKGFTVTTFIHTNNCFDIAAKKNGKIFLVKILENIDALRKEQANELRRISSMAFASALVVGEKSKAFTLSSGVIYERHGVNCVSLETFKGVVENDLPKARYFKGKKIVELDAEKMRKKREKLGLTLQQVADRIKSTPKSVHSYETGASALVETAEKLEQVLGKGIVRKIDVLGPPETGGFMHGKNEESFEKLKELGFRLEFFSHAPFRAYSHESENIFLNQGKIKKDIRRKAQELIKTKKIVGGLPVIIARNFEKDALEGVPIVREEELESMTKKSNLLEMARERQNAKRKSI